MLYATIIASGLICGLVALVAWHNRSQRGAWDFLVLMLAVMVWSLAYAQELRSSDLPSKIFWAKVEYLGVVSVPITWFAFAIRYTGHERRVTQWQMRLLAVPSLIMLGLVWTNESHGMIWRSINMVPHESFIGWKAEYGIGFWLFTTYAYGLMLIGTLLLWAIVQRPTLYRSQSIALIVGSLLPWLGNLLYNLGLSPLPDVELAPFAFTVTGLVYAWALWRWRLFDLVPVARDRVIERMRDGVIVLDSKDRVVDINPAACEVISWERNAVLGKPVKEVISQYAAMADQFSAVGEVDEQIVVGEGDVRRVFQVRISALYEQSGAPGGRLVILSDITRIKQAEQDLISARMVAEAANEAKSTFLATMSHEIRTPMNGVLGMAELLMESPLSPPQHELAQMIHTSGSQLMRMINTILDFSKIEAGQLSLDMQPFGLRVCIESALDLVAPAAAEKGLDLSYVIMPGTPSTVLQDQTRLRQILVNLLNNAVKFTQQGDVALRVMYEHAEGHPDGPHTLTFTVRDTGIGIPADRMDRLFRSFSQVDATTARTYGGTGLGLMISKLLAKAMGGDMSVESEVGCGSTFSFWIVASATDAPPQPYDLPHPQLRGRRALVVDDSAACRESLAVALENWGLVATTVESGGLALELLRGGASFDLAILDLQMPEMGGAELATALRRARPARPLPIVLLSTLGTDLPDLRDATMALLRKPVKIIRLYEMLSSLHQAGTIQRFQAARAARRQEQRANESPAQPPAPLRILLAEDNNINQQLITKMLDRMGYHADIVPNGRGAVEALRRQCYDLVLMDLQMPEMDGLEATRIIRAEVVGKQQPWIIAVTAGEIAGGQEACLMAGMNDFITKPVAHERLARALERYRAQERLQKQALEPEPPPAAPPTMTISLDLTVVEQLKNTLGEQGPDLLPTLIATFLENADTLQTSAHEALARGDSPTLRRAMHTLKSNASTFGAQPLATLCRELEQRAAEGQLEGTQAMLAEVALEFAKVREALSSLKPDA